MSILIHSQAQDWVPAHVGQLLGTELSEPPGTMWLEDSKGARFTSHLNLNQYLATPGDLQCREVTEFVLYGAREMREITLLPRKSDTRAGAVLRPRGSFGSLNAAPAIA